jgi:4-hydroxy-2-oxoheptanedioate aldolase
MANSDHCNFREPQDVANIFLDGLTDPFSTDDEKSFTQFECQCKDYKWNLPPPSDFSENSAFVWRLQAHNAVPCNRTDRKHHSAFEMLTIVNRCDSLRRRLRVFSPDGSRFLSENFRATFSTQSSGRISTRSHDMQWINRVRLKTDVLAGTFLNLGSATSVEIAAGVGFDWLLLDLEHGSGSFSTLRAQLLAVRGSSAAPIVRLPSIDPDLVKFVMDSGAAGVMFPYVADAIEAARAVHCMKYPPTGSRGVAQVIRATDYGRDWKGYLAEANENSLVVVQIETPEAADQADAMAAVPGVDVLFVGPMDLSVNLGHPGDFTPPGFEQHLKNVVAACERHGKTAGILSRPELVAQHRELGYRFIALGSDSGAVVQGMAQNLATLRK